MATCSMHVPCILLCHAADKLNAEASKLEQEKEQKEVSNHLFFMLILSVPIAMAMMLDCDNTCS